MDNLIIKTDEIKKAREMRGYSMRDMAKFMNVKSQSTYFKIENGKIDVKISQALMISRILKQPITNFFKLKV